MHAPACYNTELVYCVQFKVYVAPHLNVVRSEQKLSVQIRLLYQIIVRDCHLQTKRLSNIAPPSAPPTPALPFPPAFFPLLTWHSS